MNTFGSKVAVIGLIGTVSSVAWWYSFYTDVLQTVGGKRMPLECLYQGGGPCGIVNRAASWLGAEPYHPRVFVVSVVALAVGVVMHLYSAVRDGMEPPPMPRRSPNGRTRDFN